MSVALSAIKIERLVGSWVMQVQASVPLSWWRLGEITGATTAVDSAAGAHNGTYNGAPTLDLDTDLGDGGMRFDGINDDVNMGDVAAFEFTSAYSVEYIIRSTFLPSVGYVLLGKTGGVMTTGWVIQIGTTGSTLWAHRNVAGSANIWIVNSQINVLDGNWHHVVHTWDGTAGANAAKTYVDGVLDFAVTPTGATVGTEPTAAFAIGTTPGGLGPFERFKGDLDEVVLYTRALNAGEIMEHAEACCFDDVTPDVLASQAITCSYGISGNGPTDRIADVGRGEFWVRNDAGNSGGVAGYYSPGHVNQVEGLIPGSPVRISLTYNGTPYIRWTGRVESYSPESGQYLSRRTRISCVGYMGGLLDAQLKNLTLQTNQTEKQLLDTIIAAMPEAARPRRTIFDTGLDTVPYAFDDVGEGASAIALAGSIVLSSMGFLYVDSFGYLHYENRHTRQTSSTSYIFDNSMTNLAAITSYEGAYNRFNLEFPQKRIDAAATTVLFSIPAASATNPSTIPIGAGATIEFWGTYFNPSNVEQKIGGTAQVAPVATTDYLGNAAADGSGTNKTAQLTVTATSFATTTKFTIANADAATVYVTKLQIRGKGLYDDGVQSVEAVSTQVYGDRIVSIKLPYQSNPLIAQDLANYLLLQYQSQITQALTMTFSPHDSDAQMLAFLNADIGDRITIQEAQTGINSDLFIHNIAFSITEGKIVKATYGLASSIFSNQFWILEDAGSLLGTNTFLGFA